MKRIQIRLDDGTYAVLCRRAFEQGGLISSYVREGLASSLGTGAPKQKLTLRGFRFIGAGRSRQGRLPPISQRHDEALVEALTEEHR